MLGIRNSGFHSEFAQVHLRLSSLPPQASLVGMSANVILSRGRSKLRKLEAEKINIYAEFCADPLSVPCQRG